MASLNDFPTCAKCRKPHVRKTPKGYVAACTGHISGISHPDRKDEPCGNFKPRFGDKCRYHGGAARQVKAKQEKRRVVAEIAADTAALLAAEGLEGVADPVAEIGRLAQEALALKRAAGARANALTDIRYTGGLQRDDAGELVGTGTEQLRAEVALYERALDRSMKFLEVVAKHTVTQDVDDTKAMLTALGEALGLGSA